jgi:O-methyltransferase
MRPDILWRSHTLATRLREADLTMVTPRRARTLYRLARAVERRNIPGAIVDCGVWNGGSSILLSRGAPTRPVRAFDSFKGLPAPTSKDMDGPLMEVGEFRGSPEQVDRGFREYADVSRLNIVEGWFERTLQAASERIGAIAILHVDVDYYEPVRLALQVFYPSVSRGGYVIVDDYFSFPGTRRATDELRAQHGVSARLVWDHYWRR